MPSITIKLDGPEALTPIAEGAKVHHVTAPFELALVLGGMQSGAPSVMLSIPLPDGSRAIVETSLALLDAACRAMHGRLEYLAEAKGGSS
jgi:hypothetical protein